MSYHCTHQLSHVIARTKVKHVIALSKPHELLYLEETGNGRRSCDEITAMTYHIVPCLIIVYQSYCMSHCTMLCYKILVKIIRFNITSDTIFWLQSIKAKLMMVWHYLRIICKKKTRNDVILFWRRRGQSGYEATFTIVASCPIVYTSVLHK